MAENRAERIKTLENALSLLSSEATEADKALIRGELQTLNDELAQENAARKRIRDAYHEKVDPLKPLMRALKMETQINPFHKNRDNVATALLNALQAYENRERYYCSQQGVTILD